MALYLITYDMHHESSTESATLRDRLADLKAKEILESVWLHSSPNPVGAKNLAEALTRYINDQQDSLLVIEVGSDAKCLNLKEMLDDNEMLRWLVTARC